MLVFRWGFWSRPAAVRAPTVRGGSRGRCGARRPAHAAWACHRPPCCSTTSRTIGTIRLRVLPSAGQRTNTSAACEQRGGAGRAAGSAGGARDVRRAAPLGAPSGGPAGPHAAAHLRGGQAQAFAHQLSHERRRPVLSGVAKQRGAVLQQRRHGGRAHAHAAQARGHAVCVPHQRKLALGAEPLHAGGKCHSVCHALPCAQRTQRGQRRHLRRRLWHGKEGGVCEAGCRGGAPCDPGHTAPPPCRAYGQAQCSHTRTPPRARPHSRAPGCTCRMRWGSGRGWYTSGI